MFDRQFFRIKLDKNNISGAKLHRLLSHLSLFLFLPLCIVVMQAEQRQHTYILPLAHLVLGDKPPERVTTTPVTLHRPLGLREKLSNSLLTQTIAGMDARGREGGKKGGIEGGGQHNESVPAVTTTKQNKVKIYCI